MKYYFHCPQCQNDEEFTVVEEDTSNLGCTLFFWGGLMASLLFSRAMRNRVQCVKCGYIFQQPPIPRTGVSSLAFGVNSIIFFGILLTAIMMSPFWSQLLSGGSTRWWIEQQVIENPRAFTVGTILTLGLVFLLCLIASKLSMIKQCKKFRQQYETSPQPLPPPAGTRPTDDGESS